MRRTALRAVDGAITAALAASAGAFTTAGADALATAPDLETTGLGVLLLAWGSACGREVLRR